MAFRVAMHEIISLTRAVSRSGRRLRSCATAPETCGQAIDVPEIVLIAVSLVGHAAVIELPGA
jgi:hypothetical protein